MEKENRIIDKIPGKTKQIFYMVAAVIASCLLVSHVPLSFQGDKGIIYMRDYTMGAKTFNVVQTDLETGVKEVTESMSVRSLHYCAWAIVITSIGCLLCVSEPVIRTHLCLTAAILGGIYYLLLVYYAVRITDDYTATTYPNWAAILPFIVIHTMMAVRQETIRSLIEDED